MRKKILLITLGLVLAVSMVATGCQTQEPAPTPTPTPTTPEVVKWRLQALVPPADLTYELLPLFSDMVKEKSGGRIEISLYPANELIKVPDMLDACGKGTIEMMVGTGAYWQGIVPEGAIESHLPMSWRDSLEAYSVFDHGLRDLVSEAYAEHNVHYLAEIAWPSWTLFVNKPINKVEDFQGLKLRATGAQEAFLAKLGASTVMLTGEEIYTALQLGTVDGVGWSAQGWEIENYKEVAQYYIQPSLGVFVGHVQINMDAWNSLPDDLKNVVAWSSEHYARVVSSEFLAAKRKQEAAMQEGVMIVIPDAEVAKMREVALEVWDEIAAKSPRHAAAVEIVKDYLKSQGVIK